MKTTKTRLFVALALGLIVSVLSYGQTMYVTHNTGSNEFIYGEGVGEDVNFSTGDASDVTAPAPYLYCEFLSPNDIADMRAWVDSTYPVGYYYIGYFPGGSDWYLDITS